MTLEKLTDVLDMASQLQEQQNEQAIARVRQSDKPQSHPDFDGEHCVDCDIEMPELRLSMHRIRCTSCESVVEKARSMMRR